MNRRWITALAAVVRAMGAGPHGEPPLQVIHAAGSSEPLVTLRDAYRSAGIPACVRPFFKDMAAVYGTADALLCRAGGTTLAELTALGVPSVLVPYPHPRDGHQRENARALVDRGAATLLEEDEMTPQAVATHVAPLLSDQAVRDRRAREARRLGRPDAADRVVDLILELANSGGRPS